MRMTRFLLISAIACCAAADGGCNSGGICGKGHAGGSVRPVEADTLAHFGVEVIGGHRFTTIGGTKASVCTNPPEDERRLGYKYIYIPAECALNDKESVNFAVLRVTSRGPDTRRLAVFLKEGDKLWPCTRVEASGSGMFDVEYRDAEGAASYPWPGWNAYLANLNGCQQQFDGRLYADLHSLRQAMSDTIRGGIDDSDGIAAGRYWVSPPITDTFPKGMNFIVLVCPHGGPEPPCSPTAPAASEGQTAPAPIAGAEHVEKP